MAQKRALVLAMVCVLVGCALASAQDEWPEWRGRKRDGKSPDKGLLKEWRRAPKPLWKFTALGEGYSSVSAAGDTIYGSGGVEGRLTVSALDMQGKVKWRSRLGQAWTGRRAPGARVTPTFADGRIYMMSGSGGISCLDARTGKRVWSKDMRRDFGARTPHWGFAESVLVTDGMAIVSPGGRNGMVAMDKNTGKTRWTSRGNGAAAHYCSAIVFTYKGRKMIVNGNRGGLFCVDARDGRTLWTNSFAANNTANCPTPAFSDGYVFWAVGYNKGGICLKLDVRGDHVTAREAWRTDDMNCHHGGYIIEKGYIYGNNGGGWACLDLKSGRTVWNSRGVGKGSVCFADGMLYTYSERRGRMWLVPAKPNGFEVKGKFRVTGTGRWSWAHPTVIKGRLYVRYGTKLYCLDVKSPR